jgi:hypothetical protein
MNDISIVLIILTVLFVVVLTNVLIIRHVINRALKKFVKPTLTERGVNFIGYKWNMIAPLVKQGITFSTNGSSELSIYIDVFYVDVDLRKKVTVRIDTIVFFIRKVAYDKYFMAKPADQQT